MAFLYIHRVELPQTICSAGEAEQCQGPYYGSWDQPDLDLNPSSAAYCCVTLVFSFLPFKSSRACVTKVFD